MRRLVCWLFGHDWHADFTAFASKGECTLRCDRCDRRVRCGEWIRR